MASDQGAPSAGSGGSPVDIGAHYRDGRARVTDLVSGLPARALDAPVVACPGWSVHDVVAHLVGVVEDAAAGRLTGPPPPEMTAAQVARHRDDAVSALLGTWSELAPPFEEMVTAATIWPALLDVLSHEHDIRAAIGRPGERANESMLISGRRLARVPGVPVRIEITDDSSPAQPALAGRDPSPPR